jgi:prevent-host-death family protein
MVTTMGYNVVTEGIPVPEYVGVRELKARLSHYLQRAAAGERVVVTEHGRPLAEISPCLQRPEDRLQSLVASGKIKWSGKKPTVSPPVASTYPGRSVAELVLRDRE